MDLPEEIPVMTLPNAILFPGVMLPLYIFEPRYRKMLQAVLESYRMFAIAMQKPGESRGTPSMVAGLGLVRAAVTHPDGTSHLVLQGTARIQLLGAARKRPFRVEYFRPLETTRTNDNKVQELTQRVLDLVAQRFKQGLPLPMLDQFLKGMKKKNKTAIKAANRAAIENIIEYLADMQDPDQLADLVSCTLLPRASQRQVILESLELESRLQHLVLFLLAEIHAQAPKK
jgi:Lon protease-like protein